MNWRDWSTRAMVSVVIAALAAVTLVVPPISFFLSLIGISFGLTTVLTSPPHSESRRVAKRATITSAAALMFLIVGGLVYSALS